MDKKSILAIVLITVVILLLPSYYKLINGEQIDNNPYVSEQAQEPIEKQNAPEVKPESKIEKEKPKEEIKKLKENVKENFDDKSYTISQAEKEYFVEIETPLVSAKLSNKGGGNFSYWYLKKYDTWMKNPVKIIDEYLQNGIEISFVSIDGEKINLNDYTFYSERDENRKVVLNPGDKLQLSYNIEINDFKIEKRLTFYSDSYHFDLQFFIKNPDQLLLNGEYQIGWIHGLPSNEKNIVEEYTYSDAYASMGEELESFTIDSEDDIEPITFTGKTDWIATRTKYFISAIAPREAKTVGVNFNGAGVKMNEVLERRYDTSMNISKQNDGKSDSYSIYMGPLDYSILSDYELGIDKIVMNHGWYEKTFRGISLFLVSILKFFFIFIPNYGIVIIIFSILVKIVVYPLTKKSYKSMKEMSKAQPLLAEIKEKYKGDPQRMQKETMKLYKEHGINPLGGCLPMLLQLPLLGALFIVFRSTIQLRGASFIPGWIDDLSMADTLFTLPFSLPMYGNQFNLLPILMAVSMMFQSKMTMQDPKQKAMVYFMPIFMLLIFNQFPSGLNLYYTLFNVWTILQQKLTDGDKSPSPVKK